MTISIEKAINLILQWAICLFIGFVIGMLCGAKWEGDVWRAKKAPDTPAKQTTQIWRVTAYCPCKLCCGVHSDGITASGAKAEGKLIAAPRSIPFGTWIDIKGYGYAEVLDRGGAIKGRRLDVFFPTHQEALNWGVKHIKLEIL